MAECVETRVRRRAGPEWIGLWGRAARLPFTTASALPCLVGALLAPAVDGVPLGLSLAAVVLAHLSANLINDYADSRSGADWKDRTYFGFFGGSQLIQAGVLREAAYRRAALACAAGCVAAIAAAAWRMGTAAPLAWLAAVLALAWGYSHRPLRLVYRGLGEATIFLLFGPATVLGAYYLQTGQFPAARPALVSWPVGLAVAAILIANEFPDRRTDAGAGKRTLVVRLGRRGGLWLYATVWLAAGAGVAACVGSGALGPWGWLGLVGLIPAALSARVIARAGEDRARYVASARLVILAQTLTTLGLLAGA